MLVIFICIHTFPAETEQSNTSQIQQDWQNGYPTTTKSESSIPAISKSSVQKEEHKNNNLEGLRKLCGFCNIKTFS